MRNLIKYTFSLVRLNSIEMQSQLSEYRPWSLPLNTYSNLHFQSSAQSFFTDIIRQRYNLKDHNNLINKAGLYILAKSVEELTEKQLIMFANIDFQEGKNPLNNGNIEHIIRTAVSRKDISLETKLLLCLKSKSKSILSRGIIDDISKELWNLDLQKAIEVLILLQKCIQKVDQTTQFNQTIINQALTHQILYYKGELRIVGEGMLYASRLITQVDKQNISEVIDSGTFSLQTICSLFVLKDLINLSMNELNKIFKVLFRYLPDTNRENSWMIISIFSNLSVDQKLYVMDQIPIKSLHPSDYVMYLEVLSQSDLQVQINGNHMFPYWIKNQTTAEEFQRLLSLRFDLKYDNQELLPQIINSSYSSNLTNFKGLINFLSTIELQSQLPLNMIAKSLKQIIQSSQLQNYDIVQFYNVVALLAKHNFCKNKFWREIQGDLIEHIEEVIEMVNYLSVEEREEFLSHSVLLLRNHVGRSKIEEIVLDELKMALGELWTVKGLTELVKNLSIVGIGEPEVWGFIQENLQMVRQQTFVEHQLLTILKVMLRMNKGSGYYWRRLGQSLPIAFVEQLRAEALKLEQRQISNYLKQGYGKRKILADQK